ncbi:MAG: hypothetical protein GXP27_16430 [Planctomycetes bacterium]|nr:hypothetical protein [Planctomycetota bacterium]
MRRFLNVVVTLIASLPVAYGVVRLTSHERLHGLRGAVGLFFVGVIMVAVVGVGAMVASATVFVCDRESPWSERLARYSIDLLTLSFATFVTAAILHRLGVSLY